MEIEVERVYCLEARMRCGDGPCPSVDADEILSLRRGWKWRVGEGGEGETHEQESEGRG